MPDLFLQYLQIQRPDACDVAMSVIMLSRLQSQRSSGYAIRCAELADHLFAEKEKIIFAGYPLNCSAQLNKPNQMPSYIRLYLYESLNAAGLVELIRGENGTCYRITQDAGAESSRSIRAVSQWLHERFPSIYENPRPLRKPLSDFEKLQRRIEREFVNKPFIGDIRIDDTEYGLLIEHMKNIYSRILMGRHDCLDRCTTSVLV